MYWVDLMFLRRVGICLTAAMLASLLQVATVSSPAAAARGFTPKPGVTFNSAIGSEREKSRMGVPLAPEAGGARLVMSDGPVGGRIDCANLTC